MWRCCDVFLLSYVVTLLPSSCCHLKTCSMDCKVSRQCQACILKSLKEPETVWKPWKIQLLISKSKSELVTKTVFGCPGMPIQLARPWQAYLINRQSWQSRGASNFCPAAPQAAHAAFLRQPGGTPSIDDSDELTRNSNLSVFLHKNCMLSLDLTAVICKTVAFQRLLSGWSQKS